MIWTGFIPTGLAIPVTPPPESEQEEAPPTTRIPPPPPPPKKAPVLTVKKKDDEWIDIGMVEEILAEKNGLELNWLKSLLKEGVKIKNTTGRYLKIDRFLDRIEQIKNGSGKSSTTVE